MEYGGADCDNRGVIIRTTSCGCWREWCWLIEDEFVLVGV